ncbi:E3 ubiquitin-protein ligase MARCHF2-like [Ornithodoros turicata]|uniref:E3 ubiquitin-protein ligase MARCHF2-like n=1 Tax=Ornithodoros turicata TaxID=34597 RepID=UPI0031390D34
MASQSSAAAPKDDIRCRRPATPVTPASPNRSSLPCQGRYSDPSRRSKSALERSRNLLDVYCTPTRTASGKRIEVVRPQRGIVRSSTLNNGAPGHDSWNKFSTASSPCSLIRGTANVTASSGPICRICHEGEQAGPLASYCICSGTMGLMHAHCLERWLTSSNTDTCEVCHETFPTVTYKRSFKEWVGVDVNRKAVVADLLCFFLLSPVAGLGSEVCFQGAAQQANVRNVWQAGCLILLSCLLVGAFFIWAYLTTKHHYRAFRQWQNMNPRYKVVPLKRCAESKIDVSCTAL